MWDCAYSKDEGSRVKLPNGHQWTPKDCKNHLNITINMLSHVKFSYITSCLHKPKHIYTHKFIKEQQVVLFFKDLRRHKRRKIDYEKMTQNHESKVGI